MNHYLGVLLIGFSLFMAGTGYAVFLILKMAHDEDPGCLNPGKHDRKHH